MICTISTKTTGLKPGIHEVIELSIKPIGLSPVTYRVQPKRLEIYEEKVQKINGIGTEALKQFPFAEEVAPKILDQFKNITPLGHYVRFDLDMIYTSFGNSFYLELFGANKPLDTAILVEKDNLARIERMELKRFPSNALKKVCSVLGIEFVDKCSAIEEVHRRLTNGQ